MVNDTIGDLLTRIRNAGLRRSETVSLPLTRIGQQICQILEREGLSSLLKPIQPKNYGFV